MVSSLVYIALYGISIREKSSQVNTINHYILCLAALIGPKKIFPVHFYQYNIVPDAPNAPPRHKKCPVLAEKTEFSAFLRDHDRTDRTCQQIEFDIADAAQPFSIADIDDFLFLQAGKSFPFHKIFSPFSFSTFSLCSKSLSAGFFMHVS